MDLKTFCKCLPKIELHAHLNGSLSPQTLKKLYDLAGIPSENCCLQKDDSKSLSECFSLFDLVYRVTTSPIAMKIATIDVIKEFADDNVIYLELRTTPRSIPGKMTKKSYLQAIIDGVLETKQKYSNILVKLLISFNRNFTKNDIIENFELINILRAKYPDIIVGIDVSGNPYQGSWLLEAAYQARENNLNTTIHCSEIPSIEETSEILFFKPDRIGHGSHIHPNYEGSKKLWDLLIENKIPVECCLTSNVSTNVYENYSDHHIKELINSNHPFAICTDDKGIFKTNLSNEFQHAGENFYLDQRALWEINYNTINYSFALQEEKLELMNILNQWKNDNLDA